MGFDGWKAVEDRSSAALPFGRHGVHLGKDELAGNRVLDFTRYFSRDSKWEGNDYHIWIAPSSSGWMFAAARPRNIDLGPYREDGYRTACRTQRGIYQVERFFALLTDQHLRRAYFCKPDIA
jgi:hypothetical protein